MLKYLSIGALSYGYPALADPQILYGTCRVLSPALGADDGTRTHLCVHVFMDGRHAVAVPFPPQICGHAAISVYSIMAVVDAANLLLNLCFWGIIIHFSVFPVIIVGIGADPQAPQEPTDANFFLMTANKSISL